MVCDKTAHEYYVKCFPTCLCFLNLHIGTKEITPKLIFRSKAILSAVGPALNLIIIYLSEHLNVLATMFSVMSKRNLNILRYSHSGNA